MEATVLLLQGGQNVPCKQWKARAVQRLPAQAHSALSLASRNGDRRAVVGLIVQGLGGGDKGEVSTLRRALLRTRPVVYELVQQGRLAHLPVVLEVNSPEPLASRGALARLVMQRLREVALPAQVSQPGPPTGSKPPSGQRESRLPKVKRGLAVSGGSVSSGLSMAHVFSAPSD